MSVKYFILWMITSVTLVAQASETEKTYGIETGLVEYEIYGGGVVTPECNLSIEGNEILSFKAWGDVRIEKMERKETLWGTLYSVEREKTLKKAKKRHSIRWIFRMNVSSQRTFWKAISERWM